LKNKKKKEERNKQPQKSIEASIVVFASNGDVLFATSNEKGSVSVWILDYGCTYNMYPHKDYFSTYDPVNCNVVHMGTIPNVMLLELVILKSRPMMVLLGLCQMFVMLLI